MLEDVSTTACCSTPINSQNDRNCTTNEDTYHVQGRCIIDVSYMAKTMVWDACDKRLNFQDIEGEKQMGLASIFKIKCTACQHFNKVCTGKRHGGAKGPFDVNTKAAMGGLEIGVGATHVVSGLLEALNIKIMHPKSYHAREKEVCSKLGYYAWSIYAYKPCDMSFAFHNF